MSSITDIQSVWGLSVIGYGVIAEGIANIRQCLDIIIRTSKGTDPLRMEFGSDVYKWVDAPTDVAIPNIKKAILNAVALWEPRVEIQSISHVYLYDDQESRLVFNIGYSIVDQDLIDELSINLNASDITTYSNGNTVILQAFFPPNITGKRYTVNFQINGLPAQPLALKSGFATLNDLYQWVLSHWGYYGRWYLQSDKIMLYLNSAGVNNASLEIGLKTIYRYEVALPVLDAGQMYSADFTMNGQHVNNIPEMFTTPGMFLQWFKNSLSEFGEWSLEASTIQGAFTVEYDEHFYKNRPGYKLVLISESVTNSNLNITAI